MKIEELMVVNPKTLSPSDTLEAATKQLLDQKISGAPVVDSEGSLVGILSESDVLKYMKILVEENVGMQYLSDKKHSLSLFVMLAERNHEVRESVLHQLRATTVNKAMTTNVVIAKPSDTVESVAALMIENQINRIPILENEKLVGIVTKTDFARLIAVHNPP